MSWGNRLPTDTHVLFQETLTRVWFGIGTTYSGQSGNGVSFADQSCRINEAVLECFALPTSNDQSEKMSGWVNPEKLNRPLF